MVATPGHNPTSLRPGGPQPRSRWKKSLTYTFIQLPNGKPGQVQMQPQWVRSVLITVQNNHFYNNTGFDHNYWPILMVDNIRARPTAYHTNRATFIQMMPIQMDIPPLSMSPWPSTTSPMTAWTTPRITAPVAPPPRDPGLTTEDPAMPSSTIQRGPTGRRGRKSTWPHKYTMTMLSPVLKMQWSHSFFYNSITTLYLLVAEQQHFCLESYSENNIP